MNRINPDARAQLDEVRRLILEGKLKEAHRLAAMSLSGVPETMRHYVPLGDLWLQFDHGDITAYERERPKEGSGDRPIPSRSCPL